MKKWKDLCDSCETYKLDCHSYGESREILCPECASKKGYNPWIRSTTPPPTYDFKYLSVDDSKKMIENGWTMVELPIELRETENYLVSLNEKYKKVKLYYNGTKKERKKFSMVR